jgi:hypothetical protein
LFVGGWVRYCNPCDSVSLQGCQNVFLRLCRLQLISDTVSDTAHTHVWRLERVGGWMGRCFGLLPWPREMHPGYSNLHAAHAARSPACSPHQTRNVRCFDRLVCAVQLGFSMCVCLSFELVLGCASFTRCVHASPLSCPRLDMLSGSQNAPSQHLDLISVRGCTLATAVFNFGSHFFFFFAVLLFVATSCNVNTTQQPKSHTRTHTHTRPLARWW